jgi:hypothetical protein
VVVVVVTTGDSIPNLGSGLGVVVVTVPSGTVTVLVPSGVSCDDDCVPSGNVFRRLYVLSPLVGLIASNRPWRTK